ncbi:MAG: hypothetical protein JO250_15845 [Armatimonadetes bacterium]|nr:hypothetical protein [Armatimonadota bacterium]
MNNPNPSPAQIWDRVFDRVRRMVNAPMVWLAMQSVKPITIDGNFFVVGLSADRQYLASNLQTFETVTAIEDALREFAGRILAFRLIEGETLADWEAVREREGLTPSLEPEPPAPEPPAPTPEPPRPAAPEPAREVMPTWEKLGERLQQRYKATPNIKYPHNQARFILEAVKSVSDTMDLLMPGPGQPPDDQKERALSKALERLSSTVNLDPVFLSLELFRYRESRGK